MTFRLPCDLWGWRGTALVLVALLGPLAAVVVLAPDGDGAATTAAAGAIFVGSSALASAALLQGHGRLGGNDHSRGLSLALAIVALPTLTGGGYALTHPDAVLRRATVVLAVMACLMLVAVGLAVLRLAILPGWARLRFSVAAMLGGLSLAVEGAFWTHAAWASVGLGLGILAGLVLTTTAAALLHQVVAEEQHHLAELRGRLADLEAAQRADLARLHEINTLVAGVASASRLVREIPPSESRDQLQAMIDAELDRLERMLADRARHRFEPTPRAEGPDRVDLGELVQRIAWVHRARGHGVTSMPTQVQVPGDADAVAEVLDALVENAALHGSPEHITIAVEKVGDGVDIAVSDRGPGVPRQVQDNLFGWGAHRPGSPGHGIGLYAAQARARRLGGSLRLEDAPSGARFVLHLPDRTEGVRARDRFAVVAS